MKRVCKYCGIEKDLSLFRKNGKLKDGSICYVHKCLECCNAPGRTGKPNTGRFKSGCTAGRDYWFKKGEPSLYKGFKSTQETRDKISKNRSGIKRKPESIEKFRKTVSGRGKTRKSIRGLEWTNGVKARDGFKCMHCGCDDVGRLQAHHIVPWEQNVELRFVLENGITLCRSCHTKEERRMYPNHREKGVKFTDEHKKKLSEAKKGYTPWNKGKKLMVDSNTGERKWITVT